jgi:hypothetical protein
MRVSVVMGMRVCVIAPVSGQVRMMIETRIMFGTGHMLPLLTGCGDYNTRVRIMEHSGGIF